MARPRPTKPTTHRTHDIGTYHPCNRVGGSPPHSEPQSGGPVQGSRHNRKAHAPGIPRGSPTLLPSLIHHGNNTPLLAQQPHHPLIQKEESATLDNYHPITLANALYNLWTAYIVMIATDYIESQKS